MPQTANGENTIFILRCVTFVTELSLSADDVHMYVDQSYPDRSVRAVYGRIVSRLTAPGPSGPLARGRQRVAETGKRTYCVSYQRIILRANTERFGFTRKAVGSRVAPPPARAVTHSTHTA